MAVQLERYHQIREELGAHNVSLVAVSKTKPPEDIMALYEAGHRDFGENYVQELAEKQAALPKDIRWHFIGHLQTNKAKYIVPFVHLVHGVDSWKLLHEINRQGAKAGRVVDVLLQVHIAQEETKFGLDEAELQDLIASLADVPLHHIRIRGMMGMASFTEEKRQVEKEFAYLKNLFDRYAALTTSSIQFEVLSMGMSGDYPLAVAAGSNLVRIGSLLFGARG